MSDLAVTVRGLMPQIQADLERLVRIPSIAFDEFPEQPVIEAAEATREILAAAGLANAELIDIPGGPPGVYGEIAGPPGAPTVLLYAHYDVQPAGHEGEWTTPPWEPTERNGRLYGRGTADDKCGVALHAGALRAIGSEPPVNIKVVIEGEEETGRGTFSEYVAANPDKLAADVIVVADGGNWRVGEPTLTTSLRGLAALDVEVRTLESNVHSGLFGGPCPDALIALARMLATLHDENGDVAVEGLTKEPWDGRGVDGELLRESAGMAEGVALIGDGSIAERLYTRPSITAIGLDAPSVAGAANALQAVARARISARLAPSEDPEAAIQAIAGHLERAAPWGVQVTITPHETAPGAMLVGAGRFGGAAERAMAGAYGKEPVKVGSGGAIPLCVTLARTYPDAEIILWGACDDAARIHSSDESVDLGDLERATLAEALFLASF
jgi:acetylornithine deacetylase/succinyl-diaminopimelate desuccinylase-like protein